MIELNGQLQFHPTTNVNIIEGPFTDDNHLPKNRLLYFKGFYRLGNLKTILNNDVLALEFIPTSLDLKLLEQIPETPNAKTIIDEHPHTKILDAIGMPYSKVIPEYNCHGFCFANSKFRIPFVNTLLADEFMACDENIAEYVVFFDNDVTTHSAKRNMLTGGYKFKSGFGGHFEVDNFEDAIASDINYDSYKFYKGNTKTSV